VSYYANLREFWIEWRWKWKGRNAKTNQGGDIDENYHFSKEIKCEIPTPPALKLC
jgi:hypothetical protein